VRMRSGVRLRTGSPERARTGRDNRNRTRQRFAALALVAVAVVLAGCDSLYSSAPPPPTANAMRGQLIAMHNGSRASAGIGAMGESGALDGGAQFAANRLMYTSGGGCNLVHTSAAQMNRWYGGNWAENIACAPNSPKWSCAPMQSFQNLFIGSPPHRANILNGGYGHAGVGVACGGSFTFVVVHFAP
jgi:uncharacterized protein YkwD